MKIRNKGGILLASILMIIIAVIVVLVLSLRENPIKNALNEDDNILKVLFVLENDNQVLFTDVLIYYPDSKRGSLFNIQGNTGSIWKCLDRVDRIDAIYSERGIDIYKNEISGFIGQKIPFYVLMNLEQFSEITDLLGGMKVFIPDAVDVVDEGGKRWLLPNGVVNLDGDKIKSYLMYSKPDEEDSAIEDRRQSIVVTFFESISRNSDVFSRRSTFNEIAKRFQSNLSRSELQDLFSQISHVDSDRLNPQSVDGLERTVDGKTLIFPTSNGDLIKQIVQHSINALRADGGQNIRINYSLRILNGTSSQGLASRTSRLMRDANYDVIESANADSSEYEKTVIFDHIGNEKVAKLLGDFIRCENIREEADSKTTADFTIILGKDFDGRYVRK